jgi:hypothetical protein
VEEAKIRILACRYHYYRAGSRSPGVAAVIHALGAGTVIAGIRSCVPRIPPKHSRNCHGSKIVLISATFESGRCSQETKKPAKGGLLLAVLRVKGRYADFGYLRPFSLSSKQVNPVYRPLAALDRHSYPTRQPPSDNAPSGDLALGFGRTSGTESASLSMSSKISFSFVLVRTSWTSQAQVEEHNLVSGGLLLMISPVSDTFR